MKKRAQRKISFLVALIFMGVAGYAQVISPLANKSSFHAAALVFQPVTSQNTGKELVPLTGKFDYLRVLPTTAPIVPSNLYYLQSGFFCKREWELERATHVPFRFRLGSLDHCNELEGKH